MNELKGMKNQLKFTTLAQLERFLQCTMTGEEYRQYLIGAGIITLRPENP